jgi:hypothetical protein
VQSEVDGDYPPSVGSEKEGTRLLASESRADVRALNVVGGEDATRLVGAERQDEGDKAVRRLRSAMKASTRSFWYG